jgi:anti-sigma factor RsiW
MNTAPTNREEELHAYIDGQLDATRIEAVERYLENDHAAAARIADYKQNRNELRTIFENEAEKAFPESSIITYVAGLQLSRRPRKWLAFAAVLLPVFLVGSGSGWITRGELSPPRLTGISAIAQEAIENSIVYTEDNARPVELTSANQGQLVHWLSSRLQTDVKLPDLTSSGYHLLGGRLVATEYGPAGLLIYEDAVGIRITIFIRVMPADQVPTKTVAIGNGNIRGFAWICDGQGYSVLATGSQGNLRNLADEVRRQVDPT